ncbi:MAG: hypothetical protein KAX25_05325, partial [Dehalococcoidia bacterium]|nr:hypothetical protein [Dehalococcoidia bacterium]
TGICCLDTEAPNPECTGCDSVWLYANDDLHEAPEYTGHWVRTWCGNLLGFDLHDFFDAILPDNGNGNGGPTFERGLLRLAPEEDEGDTVYLVDVGTDNIYVNKMETWGCWDERTAGVDKIVDLAVKDKRTIYALDFYGDVAMSDDYGLSRSWGDEVDSKVDNGWTIAVLGDHILVGGCDGEVSHSDEAVWEDVTFTKLEKDVPGDGDVNFVTVAFDTYFDLNDTFYAAVAGFGEHEEGNYLTTGGVYRWIIDKSETWKDLGADWWNAYTGLVLDRPGNLFTDKDTGGVLYASYISWYEYANDDDVVETRSGVARYLEPAEDVVCQECGDWDYLVEGLTYYTDEEFGTYYSLVEQLFIVMPDALKICG